ncbi:BTB/POZ domain-containing protein [Sesamum alatum]|uniref:BTB/POZ domain-containing protein n=1 Tax=Sesamum alatum TaxID=300844 RepID=A0AAE1Y3Z4_9LAMI|nr:BTB/POZ domain-containing protein [Sesamum alatum]
MSEPLCDLQVHINGQQTFFLSEGILSKYSGKLRMIIKQEKRRTQIRNSGIEIDDFPGGPDGFELVSRFCYNNGSLPITVSNVSLLHCCAVFLEMSEKASRVNLLHQTEVFLEGIFYWSWNEILTCLKNCEPFFSCAESCGLVGKLLSSLLAKIAQNSDVNFRSVSLSSSSSSPDTAPGLRSPPVCNMSPSRKAWAWWFQDLTILSPKIIEQFIRASSAYGSDNNSNNLVLTRFLLHYLKTALHSHGSKNVSKEYRGLAGTAVNGVVSMGKTAFSCRGLFWVLRIVSAFGLSRERRGALERLIGGMLDQATLDDLLVSGGGRNGEVYNVNLVVRLIRLFVHYNDKMSLHKMKKVGELIDMYLVEIGPDPNLKISKFVGVAQSLPDFARDSFDQVYRAIDIYLQSHPALSLEERSRLCRCLNYEKLSLETCKDLADNPRIPPRIAVQALGYRHWTTQTTELVNDDDCSSLMSSRSKGGSNSSDYQLVLYKGNDESGMLCSPEEMKVNLERMQWRVVELEKVCREMQGQVSRMVKLSPQHNRPLPRLC